MERFIVLKMASEEILAKMEKWYEMKKAFIQPKKCKNENNYPKFSKKDILIFIMECTHFNSHQIKLLTQLINKIIDDKFSQKVSNSEENLLN